MSALSGVFPVVPTPFTEAGGVDEAAFLRLADWALACGVDGLVFPGMASEVETLSPEERAGLVAALGRRIAGRVPFIVGASDADPARAAARGAEGKAAGAVAAMVMAPNRIGADVDGHIAYFTAVAGAAGLPIMLQNAPAPMGAGLAPAQVAEVVRAVPGVRFVKEETLPCGQHVTRILEAAGDSLDAVFGGAGARYVIDELARGAAGTMPALEIADVHVRMVRAFRSGAVAEARRLYNATLPLLALQMVFRVRATKEVLRRRGLLAGTHARAAGPVPDAQDLREIRDLLADCAGVFTRDIPEFGA
jgi:4-hydroxy-tetrahydrodipicolinate synthase